MTEKAPILPRTLAVLAALCLVGAFALAVFYPPHLTLGRLIGQLDHGLLVALQDGVRERIGEWAWQAVLMPTLQRPAWLLPLAAGIVLGGLALTTNSRRRVPGAPRRGT